MNKTQSVPAAQTLTKPPQVANQEGFTEEGLPIMEQVFDSLMHIATSIHKLNSTQTLKQTVLLG